ncbi:MAG TPA: MauE/DoxX family redox-associated membrane protein [Holophagaceae bacterium]|jgi:putative oxidoreductase|nr:MauE/DoxX family redox-associated membrane protein [Holophagaceae bacterium]
MNGFLAKLRSPWGLRLSAWLIGAVFLAAALPKIADPPGFAEALHAYRLLPDATLAPLALALPWLELLAALALLTGLARRSAALISLALLVVFMGALAINLARGNPVDCGCFGASPVVRSVAERLRSMRLDLARDALLTLLALQSLFGPRKAES